MEVKHWGTFTDNSSTFTSPYLLSFDDVEKLSKNFLPASAKTNKTVKPESSTITTQMLPISYFETDPLTQHNINLVQYSKKMEELLHQIQNSYIKTNQENIPHLPERPLKSLVQPDGPKYKLTKKGVHQVLHKSVFTVCAHEGFDITSESVLSVLVDVVDEMLVKFCNLLKVNTERELLGQSTGFTDAMERTLQDTGVNGVKELSSFYTNRVLRYNHRLRRQGELLRNECLKATNEWSRSRKTESASSAMMMQWDDSEAGESSGNEFHDGDHSYKRVLPSIESTNVEEANQLHLEDNASILELEPGLRMLYTLEQQEGSLMNAPRRSQQILMEEDSESPASFPALDSSLQNPASASKNSVKKRRKI